VKDSLNGGVLSEVIIFSQTKGSEVKSNAYGFFSYRLEKNRPELLIVYKEGYESHLISILTSSDTFLTVLLNYHRLREINIVSDSLVDNSIAKHDSRAFVITSEKLNSLPLLLGEKDIVRSLQFLPGVQTANEASTGINVRGGGSDQNQFILDDVPIYNINHLFGFVSAFNPDIVKEATFYKGDFPARYGGKLSSVIDVKSIDGNDKKFGGGFSISPVSSKLYFEGPIKKDKLSFALSARRSFIDYATPELLQEFTDYERFNFYDLNLKIKWVVGVKDRIYLSAYRGKDSFGNASSDNGASNENSTLFWQNTGASLRWNRILSKSVFANTTVVYSNYKFMSEQSSYSNGSLNYLVGYQSTLAVFTGKTDIEWLPQNNLRFRAGAGFNLYEVSPGAVEEFNGSKRYSVYYDYRPNEYNVYAESKFDFTSKFHLMAGLRADFFYNNYNYSSVQPRISLDYDFSKSMYMHAGYSHTYQPMHQLTNTSIGLPSELWVPSMRNLQPESANLFSLGANFKIKQQFAFSIDGYYKELANVIDYKPGSTFLSISQDISKNVIPDWTQNVTQGKGTAYGTEVMIEKTKGLFTGWISYTFAWAKRQFNEINFGEEFYPVFDRRHNLSVTLNYKIKRKESRKNLVEFSATWVYASANPITLPSGKILDFPFTAHDVMFQEDLTTYESYYRIKPFHRLDLAIRLIRAKDSKRTLEFGTYNVYNRANPYYYYLTGTYTSGGAGAGYAYLTLKQKSYFPILPYLSYAIKF